MPSGLFQQAVYPRQLLRNKIPPASDAARMPFLWSLPNLPHLTQPPQFRFSVSSWRYLMAQASRRPPGRSAGLTTRARDTRPLEMLQLAHSEKISAHFADLFPLPAHNQHRMKWRRTGPLRGRAQRGGLKPDTRHLKPTPKPFVIWIMACKLLIAGILCDWLVRKSLNVNHFLWKPGGGE